MNEVWIHVCALILTGCFLQDVTALNVRNEQFGKCLQVQDVHNSNGITLEECKSGSVLQEWHWSSEKNLLKNPHTGKCLTALKLQDRGSIGLWSCSAEDEEAQAWSCSKKGHLTLHGKGLHLSAHDESSEIFLSKEKGKNTKWRTLGGTTVCEEPLVKQENLGPKIITNIRIWQPPEDPGVATLKPTQPAHTTVDFHQLNSTVQSEEPGPSVNLFSMDYGIEWKVTMLVLSSLAILLGTVILILNVYQNRRKKTVVVLKSYSSLEEASQPGSPVPSERAPLTKHLTNPSRSPSIRRGEILVEWKDGTVRPLFDTYLTS